MSEGKLLNTPPPGKIAHITSPQFPMVRFEWHPVTQQLFFIRKDTFPVIHEAITKCNRLDVAQKLAEIWLLGFRTGMDPKYDWHPKKEISY